MEITSKLKERENPSPLNSPSSNGRVGGAPIQSHIPITRSDPNSPYPTTFVTADTSSFKQVVQMLTGSSEISKNLPNKQQIQNHSHDHLLPPPLPSKNFIIPPVRASPKKQGSFKLYERRNILKNMRINPLNPNFAVSSGSATTSSSPSTPFSTRHPPPEILSPSLLDFPSLTLTPVMPLADDSFDKSSSPSLGNSSGKKRATAEKGFYLHPSSISTPRDAEPQLLPLFPVTPPRVSES
ncbi:hypothetical protein Ancab_004291 [Ancistrocladus abbreviatus]